MTFNGIVIFIIVTHLYGVHSDNTKVAIVTGANKGIGYGIVQGLCEKFNGTVYLTARNEDRGTEAVTKLKELGLNSHFHQLDITDSESIKRFKQFITAKHGGVDILINNAAINLEFQTKAKKPSFNIAQSTINTNYFGTLRVCDALFPLLRRDAKVVNVGSGEGHLSKISSPELRASFSRPDLTVPELNDLMNQFLQSTKIENNEHVKLGWGKTAYTVSKAGVIALTFIQQRNFDHESPSRNIQVNTCHPGYVDTDMSDHKGPLTVQQGSRAPLFLALEPHNLRGQFIWKDTRVVNWTGTLPNPPY